MAQTSTTPSTRKDTNGREILNDIEHTNLLASGAAYADVLKFDNRANKHLIITLRETVGAQSVFYKILGSIKSGDSIPDAAASPDASYQELVAETSIAASGETVQTLTVPDCWKWIAVIIKNNSGSGTIQADARGIRD